jgi:hypothetical protein
MVNESGDHFLADPCFTGNEHLRIGTRCAFDVRFDCSNCFAAANEARFLPWRNRHLRSSFLALDRLLKVTAADEKESRREADILSVPQRPVNYLWRTLV